MRRWPCAALLLLVLAACGSTPRRDLEYDRLHASLQALASDPALARLALAERALAEAAVRRLDASSINAEEHAHLAYLAERRVDIAYIAAQTEAESARLAGLQREQAELLLAASRRETAAMREELDRQRQRELLAQEDRQRTAASPSAPPPSVPPAAAAQPSVTVPAAPLLPATAPGRSAEPAPAAPVVAAPVASEPAPVPAAPADATPAAPSSAEPAAPAGLAQRLAALAPEADSAQITLEDLAFEPGTAQLVAEAQAGVARIAAFVAREPARPIRIEGHTDATGSPDANRLLSLRRAEALRDALVGAGVAAARIAVSGEGSAQPVASNDEAEGRARNRRVVVRLLP